MLSKIYIYLFQKKRRNMTASSSLPQSKRGNFSPKQFWGRALLYILVIAAAGLFIKLIFPQTFGSLKFLMRGPQFIYTAATGSIDSLPQKDGRTNFLLMGLNSEGTAGLDLTDTMIFVSLDLTTGDTFIVSLPRDIWIESLKSKLNSAYHYGQKNDPEAGGVELAKSSVTQVVGQPVHYALILNFDGFKRIIDYIEGVDIHVDKAFDDYKYPIAGKETAQPEESRYEHLRFESGLQHMDGERALKYVRSRNAIGDEGTDFARSARQQKVIQAVKAKVLTPEIILNPKKVLALKELAQKTIKIDFPENLFPVITRTLILASGKTPQTGSISDFLVNPSIQRYGGQYVLIPEGNNWSQIHQFIACHVNDSALCTEAK
jgi:polyisoprenyl-teichoic acid--peptidoglycan teichoic acid transferase